MLRPSAAASDVAEQRPIRGSALYGSNLDTSSAPCSALLQLSFDPIRVTWSFLAAFLPWLGCCWCDMMVPDVGHHRATVDLRPRLTFDLSMPENCFRDRKDLSCWNSSMQRSSHFSDLTLVQALAFGNHYYERECFCAPERGGTRINPKHFSPSYDTIRTYALLHLSSRFDNNNLVCRVGRRR